MNAASAPSNRVVAAVGLGQLLAWALHGAGMGLMTIVKGTLPLALFGAAGFGRRAGLLEAPSRLVQALTPMLFGAWLDRWGAGAVWICAAVAALG